MTDTRSSADILDPIPPDQRADRIVAAALAAFGEKGYAESRLADIARRACVSQSTLLRYFPSKEEIFREVVRSTLLENLRAEPEATPDLAAPRADGSSSDAVRAIARRYLSTMERPELAGITRLIIAELPRFPELAVLHATEALERFVHLLERTIERGVARGELRPVDIRAAARTILATLAAHALWFAYPAIYGGVTGGDRERAAAATIETLIQALGTPSPPDTHTSQTRVLP